ncbi:MAG: SCO family protein [Flavobacteriaceae bacterium]
MKQVIFLILLCIVASCSEESEKLPYLGNPTIVNNIEIQHTIKDFSFLNQDSLVVTNDTFKNKIYIADFIFLRCPTICPVMNMELKRVYDTFKDNENVLFVSHTVDPENDTIPVLKAYSENLEVNPKKWHFLWGEQNDIFDIAKNSYFTQAYEDLDAPGGYAHSGGFILVDKNRHIRGVYDGTNSVDVDRLIKEIVILLNEESN